MIRCKHGNFGECELCGDIKPPYTVLCPVLDACCGSRMFWFNTEDERAFFIDKRTGTKAMDVGTPNTRGRKPKKVAPDIIADFRNMPFEDNCFYHIVFDPPHLTGAGTGIIAFKYGQLDATWKEDIKQGFSECFRVLKPNGTLIFKWNETQIPLREVLALTDQKPLYGHKSGKKALTHWVAFIKNGA